MPSDGDFCDLHRTLFADFVPVDYYAGNFRHDAEVGGMSCLRENVHVAGIQGRDFRLVEQQMADLCVKAEQWSRSLRFSQPDTALRFATFAAYYVGEFIRIHPFLNGNGRTSRLLWWWLCRRMCVTPQARIFPRPDSDEYAVCMSECMRGNDSLLAYTILKRLSQAGEVPLRPR
ncbi:Fic family protein [Crateriforma conspicua]